MAIKLFLARMNLTCFQAVIELVAPPEACMKRFLRIIANPSALTLTKQQVCQNNMGKKSYHN